MWLHTVAQLVEHRIAEVTGSNPVEALIFFRLLLSDCLNWKIYCDDHSLLSSTTAVHIYELFRFYILYYFVCTYFVYTSHHMVFLSTSPSHPQHSIDVDSLKVDPPIPTLLWGGHSENSITTSHLKIMHHQLAFCQVSQVLSVLDCRYKAPDKVQLGLIEKYHFSGSFFFLNEIQSCVLYFFLFPVASNKFNSRNRWLPGMCKLC